MSNAALVNFANGETSPKSRGRFDIPAYASSCRKMVNFIPEVQGPARFRNGFKRAANTYDNRAAKLMTFQYNDSAAYVLEFSAAPLKSDGTPYVGSGKMVVYKDGVEVGSANSDYDDPRELDTLTSTQSGDTLYLAQRDNRPKKVTVGLDGQWVVQEYARTHDPFPPVYNVRGVLNDAIGEITFDANPTDDSIMKISTLEGIPEQYRTLRYRVHLKSALTYYLRDEFTNEPVDTSAWTFIPVTAINISDMPSAVAFYESRLIFFATRLRPQTIFMSKTPISTTGVARFDDFTGGADADNAAFFTLAPTTGKVDYGAWVGGMPDFLLAGTLGGVFKISGGGVNEPITPSSISVRQVEAYGCEPVPPALSGNRAFYIQRGGKVFRSFQYDINADDYSGKNEVLNAEQVAYSKLERVAFRTGVLDTLWVVRADGQLAVLTVLGRENIAGWHRYDIGGTDAKVLDVAILPREDNDDQVWIVSERTIDGGTKRFIEVLTDPVEFPDPEDFYTGPDDATANNTSYVNAVYRKQEDYIYMDCAATYNGSDRGVTAGATLTPGAVTGDTITFTASAAVFEAGDVGSELWKKPLATTGVGSGRATIVTFTSTTVVVCNITEDFDDADAIPAIDWYIAADEISGLSHLEAESVSVTGDGAVIADGELSGEYDAITVASGAITLPRNAAVVHVGLAYEGMIQTQNIEIGGRSGPAQDKPRNIVEMAIRFLNTLGVDYGTDPYHMDQVVDWSNLFITDRPAPVFSGMKKLHYSDVWSIDGADKHVVIMQRLPLPCSVQFIDIYYSSSED